MEVYRLRELDYFVLEAAKDEAKLNILINQNEFNILKCASTVTHHYVTKSDDEWSIALLAFVQAVKSYELAKGSFIKFAELIIKRRLIDYSRSQGKYNSEISVNPIIFDGEQGEMEEDVSIQIAVTNEITKETNTDIKYEIESVNTIFLQYGFSFFDLTTCSPQAKKTKTACSKAVAFLLHNPVIIHEIRSTKMLPIKIIEKNAKVPRKILERHRKYIIAAVEILSGEFPNLAEYLRYIREETNI